MKKVLFIVAGENFRDEEYFTPAEILRKAGYQIFTASDKSAGEIALGINGGEEKIDYSLKEVKPEEFDLIVFVGGPGAIKHLNNETSYKIAGKVVELNKLLAAICITPTILARAGVFKNKKATAWTSALNKKSIEILKENGAVYVDEPVVQDGKIITANGPEAAEAFGKALQKILE